METQSNLLKITVRLILATLIILIMVVVKELLVPFTWSLLIALSSVKLIEWLQQKTGMMRGAVISLYLVFILLILFSLGYFFYFELHNIFNDLPSILENISDKLHSLSISLQNIGIAIPNHVDKSYISDWVHQHKELMNSFVSAFGFNIWNIVLIMFYLFFLLYYKDLVNHFFTSHIKNKRKLVTARNYIEKSLSVKRGYIYGLLVVTIVRKHIKFNCILNIWDEVCPFLCSFFSNSKSNPIYWKSNRLNDYYDICINYP